LSVYEQIGKRLDNIDHQSVSQDEFDDYMQAGNHTHLKSLLLNGGVKMPKENVGTWLALSLMAIDILSIPAMSVEPERIFSSARRTISWERAQLGAETIEKAECLRLPWFIVH
jgi:hypothetical protein